MQMRNGKPDRAGQRVASGLRVDVGSVVCGCRDCRPKRAPEEGPAAGRGPGGGEGSPRPGFFPRIKRLGGLGPPDN